MRFFWLGTVYKWDGYLLNGDAPHNNHLRERLTFLAQELEKITVSQSRYGDRKSKILFFNAQKRGENRGKDSVSEKRSAQQ